MPTNRIKRANAIEPRQDKGLRAIVTPCRPETVRGHPTVFRAMCWLAAINRAWRQPVRRRWAVGVATDTPTARCWAGANAAGRPDGTSRLPCALCITNPQWHTDCSI